MDTKKIVVWVIVVAVVGIAAYYGYSYYSAKSQPATSGTQATATTTPEQVQGQEVKVGTGDEAKPGMEVTVDYVGKLTDGTVFDSSTGKAPLVFTLGAQGIIPGFQVGVNGMKVGGERLLAIPPSLGYGAQQVGTIPPNSTLIFDVKLLKVATPKPAAEPATP
ncbi:MAG: FKBP-type peptidyl-prolyl cis-trans isomerase [bacterium]|nr:FKBP-type peptidyl-prolyl cis-trans isomerase [bacterium]